MLKTWIAAGTSLIAFAMPATPGHAQRWSDPNFAAAANVTVHRGPPIGMGHHDRNHSHRHGGGGLDGGWWGGWYDPDLNRSWDSDSYNDWWHDRPDRAYPRWVQHNEGCDEGRMWQGGGVWRCSW